jgi:Major Facilitator Superfamily
VPKGCQAGNNPYAFIGGFRIRTHRSTGAVKKQNRLSRASSARKLEDLDLLVPSNRAWASNASALAILISDSLMRPSGANKEVLSLTHSLDAGTASGYFVLRPPRWVGTCTAWPVSTRNAPLPELHVPKGYRVEAIYAVGRLGGSSKLPAALEGTEASEHRLPLKGLAFEGKFKGEQNTRRHVKLPGSLDRHSHPMSSAIIEHADGLPQPQRNWAILTIALGLVMAVMDGAIANVALPTIAKDLNASPAFSIWIVNGYQLAITISLLPLASLGEIIGYRRVYLAGLLLFTLASLLCALAHTLPLLTVARILQGFGAAGIMSVNMALVRYIYPRALLGRGIGMNALVVAVSAAVGSRSAAKQRGLYCTVSSGITDTAIPASS